MNGSELVAISRLIKATGKAIGEIVNSEGGQKVISAVEKGISTTFNKGIKTFKNSTTHLTNIDLKKEIKTLEDIQNRTKEYEGIIITDSELKKIIEWENNNETIYITFFKYLLLLYAIKFRGMTKYLKKLTEIKTCLDTLYNGQIKKELLNVNTKKEISILIRLWIPLLTKQIYKEIKENEEYIVNNK